MVNHLLAGVIMTLGNKGKEEVFILDHSFRSCFHSHCCYRSFMAEGVHGGKLMEASKQRDGQYRAVTKIGFFSRAAIMIYFTQEDPHLNSTFNYESINGLTHC